MSIIGVSNYYNTSNYGAGSYQNKRTETQTNIQKTDVKLSISKEVMESYRNRIQQNGQETYDDVIQRRELLKSGKIKDIDHGYEISKKAAAWNKEAAKRGQNTLSTTDRKKGYTEAYAELYDEIVQGYEAGTREIYVADENGTRKLTKDEELSNLDAAYKRSMDDFVAMEKTNQHARGIIRAEMDRISKLKVGR